jgi:hypothetical protein
VAIGVRKDKSVIHLRARKDRRMSNHRRIEKYVNACLSEAKGFSKLMRERRLQQRKAYKGRRFRHEDVTRGSD